MIRNEFNLGIPKKTYVKKNVFARQAALQLSKALRQKNLLTRSPRLEQWEADLADCARHVGEDRLAKALDWYCLNMGNEYMPEAYSANSFVDKFLQIERHMNEDPSNVVVSDEVHESVKGLLEEFAWPAKYEQVLAVAFQRSMDAYAPFLERVKGLKTSLQGSADNKDRQDMSLLEQLFEVGFFCGPLHFVRYVWLRAVGRKVVKDNGYPVKLMAWTAGRELFAFLGREEAISYTGKWQRWDSLAGRWNEK